MSERWTAERAWEWFNRQPWLVGCNFIPSTAINQLEMFMAETFDPETIERELGWASGLGFNTVRVYLHDLLWLHDREGFKSRLNRFLDIAVSKGIRPLLVIFDDCWNQEFQWGTQPAPKPGVHNSGWIQSPGTKVVTNPAEWGRLEEYVLGLLDAFGKDERILMWDLYNEPGNNNLGEKSLGLLQAVFGWARRANPQQPVSVGVWYDNDILNQYQLANSDVITFHNYLDPENLENQILSLQKLGRPMICTEYMARRQNSRFQTNLPVFKKYRVGAINWGLVSGKTQTKYPWGWPENGPEPDPWFHEIFNEDGTPYQQEEVDAIKSLTRS